MKQSLSDRHFSIPKVIAIFKFTIFENTFFTIKSEGKMRRKIIAGNWKMNNDIDATKSLISSLAKSLNNNLNCNVIVCPPFTSLSEANNLLQNTVIKLGAQNMYFENEGAFTGEISAQMLKSTGAEFVILGHSERRAIFNESNSIINKKIKKAISSGLKPIFCVGETLEQREKDETKDVIKTQISEGLHGYFE